MCDNAKPFGSSVFVGWKNRHSLLDKQRQQDRAQLVLLVSCWFKLLDLRAALEISLSCLSEGVIELIQYRGSYLAIFWAPA